MIRWFLRSENFNVFWFGFEKQIDKRYKKYYILLFTNVDEDNDALVLCAMEGILE